MTRRTILFLLSLVLVAPNAYGQEPARSERKPLYTIAAEPTDQAGHEVRVTGSTDLPDGAEVTLYLFHSVNRTLVDSRVVQVRSGNVNVAFGPFAGGLYHGRYVVECTFLPGLQKVKIPLNLGEYEPLVAAEFAIGEAVDSQTQAQTVKTVAQDTIIVLRSQFIALGRVEKSHVAGTLKADELGRWSREAKDELSRLKESISAIEPRKKSGCPFTLELGLLTDCLGNYQRLFDRRLLVGFREDDIEEEDKGKTHGELMLEGKSPSWILRESFVQSLVRVCNTLAVPDPSAQLLAEVSSHARETLLLLARAYVDAQADGRWSLGDFDGQCRKYDEVEQRMSAALADVEIFFEKRQNLLGAEQAMYELYGNLQDARSRLAKLAMLFRTSIARKEALAEAVVVDAATLLELLCAASIRWAASTSEWGCRQLGGLVVEHSSEMPRLTSRNPFGGASSSDPMDEATWKELKAARVAAGMRQFSDDLDLLKTGSTSLKALLTDAATQWFARAENDLLRKKSEDQPATEEKKGTISALSLFAVDLASQVADLARLVELCKAAFSANGAVSDLETALAAAGTAARKLVGDFENWEKRAR
ncbi:MAG: hypothetical protein RDV41_10755 [Planctomycetota bacterium]|nr:hypothetical protein [Planctomycetota bacterium]